MDGIAQQLIAALGILGGLVFLFSLHFSGKYQDFSLADLFMDRGRVSARKFYEAGAFFLTSLWFATEIILERADLTDMLSFAGLWAAVRTVGQINHLKHGGKDDAG